MEYERLIAKVRDAAGIVTTAEAESLTHSTLTALATRLHGNEARDLASQLPDPLKDDVADAGVSQERFTLEDFFARIAEIEGVDANEAERRALAVTGVVSEAITRGELTDVFAGLPEDFGRLFARQS